MRLRRRSETDANYDSVLDTMTNVVGILIIVVAVTQLNVRKAVERTRALAFREAADMEYDPVPEADLERARREQQEAEDARRAAEAAWGGFASKVDAVDDAQEATQAEVAELEARIRSASEDRVAVEDLGKEKSSQDRKISELTLRLSNAEREIQSLKALVEAAKGNQEDRPPDLAIRIPNPNAARAKDREAAHFLLKGGKAYRFDVDALIERFAEEATQAAVRERVDPNDPREVNEFLARFGNRRRYSDGVFRLVFRTENGNFLAGRTTRLVVRCALESDAMGIPLSASGSSPGLERALAVCSPRRHWIHFLVYEDSFANYQQARALAEAKHFAAGWTPYALDEEIEYTLGGGGGGGGPVPD